MLSFSCAVVTGANIGFEWRDNWLMTTNGAPYCNCNDNEIVVNVKPNVK